MPVGSQTRVPRTRTLSSHYSHATLLRFRRKWEELLNLVRQTSWLEARAKGRGRDVGTGAGPRPFHTAGAHLALARQTRAGRAAPRPARRAPRPRVAHLRPRPAGDGQVLHRARRLHRARAPVRVCLPRGRARASSPLRCHRRGAQAVAEGLGEARAMRPARRSRLDAPSRDQAGLPSHLPRHRRGDAFAGLEGRAAAPARAHEALGADGPQRRHRPRRHTRVGRLPIRRGCANTDARLFRRVQRRAAQSHPDEGTPTKRGPGAVPQLHHLDPAHVHGDVQVPARAEGVTRAAVAPVRETVGGREGCD